MVQMAPAFRNSYINKTSGTSKLLSNCSCQELYWYHMSTTLIYNNECIIYIIYLYIYIYIYIIYLPVAQKGQ